MHHLACQVSLGSHLIAYIHLFISFHMYAYMGYITIFHLRTGSYFGWIMISRLDSAVTSKLAIINAILC